MTFLAASAKMEVDAKNADFAFFSVFCIHFALKNILIIERLILGESCLLFALYYGFCLTKLLSGY